MSERDLDPLDPDLSRLLAAERGRPPEAPEKRARIRLRVEATLGSGSTCKVLDVASTRT